MGKKHRHLLFNALKSLSFAKIPINRGKVTGKRSAKRVPLSTLSYDTMGHMMSFVPFEDQYACSQLSKDFKHAAKDTEYGEYMEKVKRYKDDGSVTSHLLKAPSRLYRGREFLRLIDFTLPPKFARVFEMNAWWFTNRRWVTVMTNLNGHLKSVMVGESEMRPEDTERYPINPPPLYYYDQSLTKEECLKWLDAINEKLASFY